jgi:curli biogenesis system outer membrane secretion channel CsgG
MKRRTLNLTGLALVMALPSIAFAQASTAPPRVAVTDMAYSINVAQYFEAGTAKSSGAVNVNASGMTATHQSSGSYVAGTYSYMEQRELGSFTNDIRGLMLKGGAFRLVQGKRFDDGGPQLTKAEQALNQIQTGKLAKPPARQPEVLDIIARIKKGEFPGADYVLFGTLSSLEFRDQLSPLQGTTSASYQFSLDLVADFSLINTKTYEIKAAFSAQGAGNDTKLLSNRGDIVRPNRGQVMRDTSQSLAANVYQQLADQLGLAQLPDASPRGNSSKAVAPPTETTTILR